MPFYQIAKMVKGKGRANPKQFAKQASGEFMKAAVVTKPEGEGPPLHMHPNEEQWTLILEGELHYVLGDEEKIVGPGDLIHIPRFTNHRSRSIGGPATFFTVKSPTGDGDIDQDYNLSKDASIAERLYALAEKKEKAAGKSKGKSKSKPKKKKATKRKVTKKKATKKKAKKTTRKKPAKKTTRKKATSKSPARKKPAKKTTRKKTARKKKRR
ncbi:MAG: cupin domain-containing protein [Rhodospirillales bacterium]|jgi:mannose-6-phosphate isomerase-like protein (cupin superfamily)